ncbi:GlcG/HbpS family heme-binding protein [Actinocatenispora rupis]|uniref:Heme-binding protein n=1 Tax=Actinocatenispora rupis TaxID=519421 RepID=A0A8J3J425_9ACTN|nr:heme-binding protein [Actinocatenispora rupis]GID11740.1 hypothetical protein Aru02nite_26290 [Actinocatenispora rupis]
MSMSITRGKVALAGAGLAVVGGVTALSLTHPAGADAAPKPTTPAITQQVPVLGVDAATRAAQAALDAAEKDGQHVTVTVVDRSGNVRVQLHGDGSGPQTGSSSEKKAFTAVSFNAPTSDLAKRVTGPGATLRDMDGTLFLSGGVPVTVKGAPVAGIGVGGAPDGSLDEKYANVGLAALR